MYQSLKVGSFCRRTLGGLMLAACFLTPPAGAQSASESPVTLTVDATRRYQRIDGFGVNFNGTYYRPAQRRVMDLLIRDLGITIVRLDPYGQSDWEMLNDNDDPFVIDWTVFRDRFSTPAFEASWAAARAFNQRGVRVYLNVSGTLPPWMLSDAPAPPAHAVCGQSITIHPFTNRPVYLAPNMYDEFAETVVALAAYARRDAKVKFDLFGPINETDCWPIEGPRVDAHEAPLLAATIGRHLLRERLDDIRLVVSEPAMLKNDYTTPMLNHEPAMPHVGVFAIHHYGTPPMTDAIQAHKERIEKSQYADRPLWMTEYGELNHLDRSAENEWTNFCLTATERLLDGLQGGVNAALWWDAFDNYHDHDKRLTYYALIANDNHRYTPKKRFFAAKNLYRFVRPGAVRIGLEGGDERLRAVAFIHERERRLVVFGRSRTALRFVLQAGDAKTRLPARMTLHLTTPTLDCKPSGTIAPRKGRAEIDLPGEAIFTVEGTF